MIYKCSSCSAEFKSDTEPRSCQKCGGTDLSFFPESKFKRGDVIAGFKLITRIGVGGMGEVWLSEQTSMDRMVALKILHHEYSKNPNFTKRFLNEIKQSAKLDHPNIVTAFDAGCSNGAYFLASAYIKGKQLQQKLNEEKIISEEESLKITLGMAKALKYAWEEFNILHRDIKPGNIIIDHLTGMPKLLDMGLAKNINEDISLTIDGDVVGTPLYISPEQAKSEEIDFRSDIYSLGATLYHISTGKLPFEGGSAMSVLAKHITENLNPPLERNPNISPNLNNLIIKMMQKDKEKRHSSWDEVINEIEHILKNRLFSSGSLKKAVLNSSSTATQSFIPSGKNDLNRTSIMEVSHPSLPKSDMEKIPEQISHINITPKKDSQPKSPDKKERVALKVSLFSFIIVVIVLGYVYLHLNRQNPDNLPFLNHIFTFLNSCEIIINTALSELISAISGQSILLKGESFLTLSSIALSFIIPALLLFSAFQSASIAEFRFRKYRFLFFIGGLFLPVVFQLAASKLLHTKKTPKNQTDKKNQVIVEDKEDYKFRLFRKIAKNDAGTPNGPFIFELMDDSTLNVEKISQVMQDMLILDVIQQNGIIKKMRVPYSGIKTFYPVKKQN